MNVENLQKLSDYLIKGELKAKFDMSLFAEKDDISSLIRQTECGSIGCAIGHGPYAGMAKTNQEDWGEYSTRVFGLYPYDEAGGWDWCFSNLWKESDNTPEGAGKRIKYLLDKGIPEGFAEEMSAESRIIYLAPFVEMYKKYQ